jgi:hypothetical protein
MSGGGSVPIGSKNESSPWGRGPARAINSSALCASAQAQKASELKQTTIEARVFAREHRKVK